MAMNAPAAPNLRRSLTDVQADYDAGNKSELENLMRAWKGIKEVDPSDLNAFFMLGGFHGEPFRGDGETNGAWWGGYCQHGTVLFPTWHRAYLYKLEQALQSIPGCESVTLPFWDECSQESLDNGIPRALTDETFELDGVVIANPLRSFVLPVAIVDHVAGDISGNPNTPNYSKPKGYETVRYPLSGLVGTAQDKFQTDAHNAGFPSYRANVLTLDANIIAWLTLPVASGGNTRGLIADKFKACMDAPNYTLFSNTTSQKAWNGANVAQVVALESPHNYIHLAVGGFDIPAYDASPITGANGDMGENDTAALDPIFYFHHCFIDYAFWTWQKRHGATDALTIDESDPGASYVVAIGANNQPPADADTTKPMTMDTALLPFLQPNSSAFTSNDVVNIETQLGYSYGPGSLDQYAQANAQANAAMLAEDAATPTRIVHVDGLDRSKINGSFLVAAYTQDGDVHRLVGVDAVLSRWNVTGCSNCQTHLKTSANFRVAAETIEQGGVKVVLHTHGGVIGDAPRALRSAGLVAGFSQVEVPFTVEIR